MKTNLMKVVVAMAAGLMATSCASTYQYVQILETRQYENAPQLCQERDGALVFQNEDCEVTYNLWSKGGDMSFDVYNRTGKILYVDLAKSFLIENGVACDYDWPNKSLAGSGTNVVAGQFEADKEEPALRSKTSMMQQYKVPVQETTVVYNQYSREQKLVAVPPHSHKRVFSHRIASTPYLSCDLPRYPEETASVAFDSVTTPFSIANYVTYFLDGNTREEVVVNRFYVSAIKNYSEPSVVDFIEMGKPCENIREPDYVPPLGKLYRKMIKPGLCNTGSSFYTYYSIKSIKRLYKKNSEYTYNFRHHAYMKGVAY